MPKKASSVFFFRSRCCYQRSRRERETFARFRENFISTFASFLSFFAMSAADDSSPVRSAGRYGSAVRALLPPGTSATLFPEGALAHERAEQQGASFETYLAAQYAAPVFQPAVAHPDFQAAAWSAASLVERHEALLDGWLFTQPDSTEPRASIARFQQLAVDPVPAFLVCGRAWAGPPGPSEYSQPFLTVLQAPFVPPQGGAMEASSVWPSTTSIGTSEWKPPASKRLFGAHLGANTRSFASSSDLQRKLSDYLPGMVLCEDGLAACDVLWASLPADSSAGDGKWSLSTIDSIDPSVAGHAVNSPVPETLTAGHRAVYVPVMFPLPALHGIPTGQLWLPSIGSADFLASIGEMSAGSSAPTTSALEWMSQSQSLKAWLDAVAMNAAPFAVRFVARASIHPALTIGHADYPNVSEETMAPLKWVEVGIARRLHRDCIRATRLQRHVDAFDLYESRAFRSVGRADSFFHPTSIEGAAFLWYWRPPTTQAWADAKFRLRSFMEEEASSPQGREFVVHKVDTRASTGGDSVPPLETQEEMDDALTSANPSPGSAATRRRLAILRAAAAKAGAVTFAGSGTNPDLYTTPPAGRESSTAQTIQPMTGRLFEDLTMSPAQPPSVPRATQTPAIPATTPGSFMGLGHSATRPAADPTIQRLAASRARAAAAAAAPASIGSSATGEQPSRFQAAAAGQQSYPDRNVRARLESSSGNPPSKQPSSWFYSALEDAAPAGFNHFSKLLCYEDAFPGGMFTNQDPVPPSWQVGLRPKQLWQHWTDAYLAPGATGEDAWHLVTHETFTLSQSGASRYHSLAINQAFFADSIFKLFVRGNRWRTWNLASMTDVAASFTPLHFLLTLPGMSAPPSIPIGRSLTGPMGADHSEHFVPSRAPRVPRGSRSHGSSGSSIR